MQKHLVNGWQGSEKHKSTTILQNYVCVRNASSFVPGLNTFNDCIQLDTNRIFAECKIVCNSVNNVVQT